LLGKVNGGLPFAGRAAETLTRIMEVLTVRIEN
jgi:hypothetical protein